ncbi:MAG: hypothetical protein DDT33_00882 [Firmicutes bacterium]|nr:hypothetical protein [Bacillota bacterium]
MPNIKPSCPPAQGPPSWKAMCILLYITSLAVTTTREISSVSGVIKKEFMLFPMKGKR